MVKDSKKCKSIKSSLQVVVSAFLLLVIQLSLYYLLSPELSFTLDERINELSDDLLPSLIAFTPISALLEEIGLRVFPYFVAIGLIQCWPGFLDLLRNVRGPEEEKLDVFMIPLFGVLNGVIHLSNVFSGSPMNMLKYFFTNLVSGAYLGAIYLRRGFLQVYATHLLYDMMVFGLMYLPEKLW